MYTNLEYAKKRLEQTLVRLKDGSPFWVKSVYPEGMGMAQEGQPMYTIDHDEEDGPKELVDSPYVSPNKISVPKLKFSEGITIGEYAPQTIKWEIPANLSTKKKTIEEVQPTVFYCYGTIVSSKKDYQAKLDEIDLTPVPLGFCNLLNEPTAVWVSRKPVRKYWRQGLGSGNISVFDFGGKGRGFPTLKYLYKTIMGEYPSLDEARQMASSKSIIAFHRHFAISESSLYYKNKEVGNAKNLSFNNRYDYLTEYFHEEVLNGNGSGNF